jgi:periplasmic protein CpxP/Spy
MKKGILFGGALVAALALLAGFAARHEMRSKRAYGFLSYRVNSILDEIEANDLQRTQVNAIKDELFKDGLALKQANQALRKELIAQWDSEVVDSAKIHALVNERVEAFRAFASKAADDAVKVHDLLTSEQRAQLKEELEEHAHSHD